MSKLQEIELVALAVVVLCILNLEALTWAALVIGGGYGLCKLLDAMAEHGNL